MIIDSHCHLDYPPLYEKLDQVVLKAKKNKIDYLLTISTTLKSFEKIKEIVNKYNNIYGTLGIHPHETKNFHNIKYVDLLNIYRDSKKIIGIGETGLDYYYNHSDRKVQKNIFIEHIKAAHKLNLPVIVHSRNAEKDTFDIINNYIKDDNIKFLIHCFTGTKDFAKKLIDIGCFISISGIITFKNSLDLVDAVKSIPLDNLLVETDSPYLSPVPFRGKPNEPSNIIYTVEKISEIKKISKEVVSNYTSKNFNKLFHIF